MGITIALTGASGNMGREVLKSFLELDFLDKINLLLENKKRERKFSK